MTQITQSGLMILTKVAKRVSNRHKFGCYEETDIEQEAVILGLDAWERWDHTRSWENFVATHIRNRLNTFRRDNYVRTTENPTNKTELRKQAKMDLANPGVIAIDDSHEMDMAQDLFVTESVQLVLDSLPPLLRNDFQRMANNASIPPIRKKNVVEAVKKILGEDWNG